MLTGIKALWSQNMTPECFGSSVCPQVRRLVGLGMRHGKHLATADVDGDDLHVVQQSNVGVLQNVVEHSVVVQAIVQVVAENGAAVQDVLQNTDVILVQNIGEADNLHIGSIKGAQRRVEVVEDADVLDCR